MATKTLARGSKTRTANKIKRRDHILFCAAELIAKDGLDALTLALLAEKADVTIPTIHNLVGKKSDLYDTLVQESMDQVMEAGASIDRSNTIAAVESFAENLITLLATNQIKFKAAFIVGERIGYFAHNRPDGIYRRSLAIATEICSQGLSDGDLQGEISTQKMAAHLFASQRLARQDWLSGYISLATYRQQLVTGMMITLCADASPAFKETLLSKLTVLS